MIYLKDLGKEIPLYEAILLEDCKDIAFQENIIILPINSDYVTIVLRTDYFNTKKLNSIINIFSKKEIVSDDKIFNIVY